jgi:hypothetical protein
MINYLYKNFQQPTRISAGGTVRNRYRHQVNHCRHINGPLPPPTGPLSLPVGPLPPTVGPLPPRWRANAPRRREEEPGGQYPPAALVQLYINANQGRGTAVQRLQDAERRLADIIRILQMYRK